MRLKTLLKVYAWHREYVVLENYKPEKEPEKKDEICVGDTVKVTDTGKQYNLYGTWSGLLGYEQNFVRGSDVSKDDEYKVLRIKNTIICLNVLLHLFRIPRQHRYSSLTLTASKGRKVGRNMADEKKQENTGIVEYESNGEIVKISPTTVRKYLVSGGGNVSDQEVMMFMSLCRYQHLNPF